MTPDERRRLIAEALEREVPRGRFAPMASHNELVRAFIDDHRQLGTLKLKTEAVRLDVNSLFDTVEIMAEIIDRLTEAAGIDAPRLRAEVIPAEVDLLDPDARAAAGLSGLPGHFSEYDPESKSFVPLEDAPLSDYPSQEPA